MVGKNFFQYLAGKNVETQGKSKFEAEAGYAEFCASELYCPKCKKAVPARERHLLYLPTGDLFDYTCPECGTSVGSRRTGPQ